MTDWHMHMRTATGARPIAFYEKVKILDAVEFEELHGLYGWVTAVSADDAGGIIYCYQVSFEEFETVYELFPEFLEGTGEIAPAARFASDEAG